VAIVLLVVMRAQAAKMQEFAGFPVALFVFHSTIRRAGKSVFGGHASPLKSDAGELREFSSGASKQ
jgi:hypothetical protein